MRFLVVGLALLVVASGPPIDVHRVSPRTVPACIGVESP
jgi:hypothetical protein